MLSALVQGSSTAQPLKFFSTSQISNKISGSSSYRKSNKKCFKKCHRGLLPWEEEDKEKPCKGILPFKRSVEDHNNAERMRYVKPCRFCPPTGPAAGKKKKKKKKRLKDECDTRPFADQGLLEKQKSVCEKRKIAKCLKKSCNPEIECKNLAPVCKKTNKVYPMSFMLPKRIAGCPNKGWKDLHKKTQKECKTK